MKPIPIKIKQALLPHAFEAMPHHLQFVWQMLVEPRFLGLVPHLFVRFPFAHRVPAGSAIFQWDYICPAHDGQGCGATISPVSASYTNGVSQLTVVLAMFPAGSQTIPTYFYWMTVSTSRVPMKGFIQNPASFFGGHFRQHGAAICRFTPIRRLLSLN